MAPIPHLPVSMRTMNNTLKYGAGVFALASATWSFAAGNFWPGLLAVIAAGLIVAGAIRNEGTDGD